MDPPFIFDNSMISHMVFIVISCITLLENSKRILRKVDVRMMMSLNFYCDALEKSLVIGKGYVKQVHK
jgi:hypothetical protein